MHEQLDTTNAKIIKLVSGEEICCTLSKSQLTKKSNLLRLDEPMLIKYVPHIGQMGVSDYIALVKWVGFTDEKIVTIPVDKIITICNATTAFTKRYTDLAISLKKAKQALPGFIEREMSEDELDNAASNYENDISNDDIKEVADLLKMPSKKLH